VTDQSVHWRGFTSTRQQFDRELAIKLANSLLPVQPKPLLTVESNLIEKALTNCIPTSMVLMPSKKM
jgi:hypothetical protein